MGSKKVQAPFPRALCAGRKPLLKDIPLGRINETRKGQDMAALFTRLSCYSEPPRPARRKARRQIADAEVLVSSSNGQEAIARIGDASTHGCSLAVEAEWLRTGRFVSLLLDDAEPLQALVRWVRDGRAGLEFLRPLPPGQGAWQDLADSAPGI
ncbi:MAG: hypothetical protein RIQ46_1580 [Pseudomonadota bacterium]|jgi:hypothetical protein